MEVEDVGWKDEGWKDGSMEVEDVGRMEGRSRGRKFYGTTPSLGTDVLPSEPESLKIL
jgi:hypothetical protein